MRGRATTVPVSAARFEQAPPSPASQRIVEPIVQRVMGQPTGRVSYQVECRVSVCRVGVVTSPGDERDPSRWFRALDADEQLGALRGRSRRGQIESVPTKDALSGAPMRQHWLYFSVPLAPGEAHPLEAPGGAATCGQRLEALERALAEQDDERQRRDDDAKVMARSFAALPSNPALTKRVTEVTRALFASDAGAASGSWECRGAGQCRWTGTARAVQRLARRIPEALAADGLPVGAVDARVRASKQDDGEGTAEIMLHVGERPRGEPGAERRERGQVIVESEAREGP